MREADFSERIKTILCERVGGRCSNPNCRRETLGPHREGDKRLSIGEAAHILGASPKGARYDARMTKEERETVFLASEYAKTRIAVVSGMAKGIDSYAHTACLNAGGYTIAILGNGLDICYPSEHHKLMKCIEEKGLLLSEYPPGTPPSRYTFPRRNRLISSWSDKLIIIQAGKGSGALITAEYSRKYGRKVEMKAEI